MHVDLLINTNFIFANLWLVLTQRPAPFFICLFLIRIQAADPA